MSDEMCGDVMRSLMRFDEVFNVIGGDVRRCDKTTRI